MMSWGQQGWWGQEGAAMGTEPILLKTFVR